MIITLISKELDSCSLGIVDTRTDLTVCLIQLAEHWANTSKDVGSIPTVIKYILVCSLWI